MVYSINEKKLINSLYISCNQNVGEAQRKYEEIKKEPISNTTITRFWKDSGYKLNTKKGGKRIALKGGRGALTDNEIEVIIKAYSEYNGNSYLAAKHLPYSHTTLNRQWNKKGLRDKPKKNKDLESRI